jgi:hypothetical protein
MSTLTLASFTPPNCQLGTNISLRVYYEQTFVASDGTYVVGNPVGGVDFYAEIPCTVSADVLTVPSFDLITTDNPQPQGAPVCRVSAVLYQGDSALETVWSQWVIPVSLAPTTTIAALSNYNRALQLTYPQPSYLNRNETVALIQSTAPTAVVATNISEGTVRLSVPAPDGAHPVVVTTNDSRVPTSLTAAGQALLDDATAADQLLTLGVTAIAAELNKLDGAGAVVASGTQAGHIADPTGGAIIDVEARAAIQSIIDALEAFGISAP